MSNRAINSVPNRLSGDNSEVRQLQANIDALLAKIEKVNNALISLKDRIIQLENDVSELRNMF